MQIVKYRISIPHVQQAVMAVSDNSQRRVDFIEIEARGSLQPLLQAFTERCCTNQKVIFGSKTLGPQHILPIIKEHSIDNGSSPNMKGACREHFHDVEAGAAEADNSYFVRIHQSFGH